MSQVVEIFLILKFAIIAVKWSLQQCLINIIDVVSKLLTPDPDFEGDHQFSSRWFDYDVYIC